MTKTFKIFSIISFIAMAIVLTFVGVWALTDLDFAVGGDITYTAPTPKINLQQDDNGFYVTMGTYNNAPVVWRLVGLDGEHFDGTTAPISGTGTFILETAECSAITCALDADSNEYINCDIRAYLNGEYVNALNLGNSAVFKSIKARSAQSLYENMGWNYNIGTDSSMSSYEIYSLSTSSKENDKLWLLSVYEVYTLLGKQTLTNNNVPAMAGALAGNYSWSAWYWLRTPYPNDLAKSFRIAYNGAWGGGIVSAAGAIRPAFNLEF